MKLITIFRVTFSKPGELTSQHAIGWADLRKIEREIIADGYTKFSWEIISKEKGTVESLANKYSQ